MKTIKLIIYWITTTMVSSGMLYSGIAQIIHTKQMIELVNALGYPVYFLNIIGVWKILGVIAILSPGFKLLKEWAYAGLFFLMTGALLSHLAVHDYAPKSILGPTMQTLFIVFSWYFRPGNRKLILENK